MANLSVRNSVRSSVVRTGLGHIAASFTARRGCYLVSYQHRSLPDSKSSPDFDEEVGGNKDVQDALEVILRTAIEKQEFKDQILDDLEERKQQFRQMGEEMKEELDRKIELDKLATEQAGNAVLAETFGKLDELDDTVRKVKEGLEADRLELEAWEQQANADRSKGLFFQTLYQTDAKKPVGGSPDKEAVGKVTAKIGEPLEQEMTSSLRRMLFTTMSTLLVFIALRDALRPGANFALDFGYVLLSALLVFNAWSESRWTPWRKDK